jgi:hypothetical protein
MVEYGGGIGNGPAGQVGGGGGVVQGGDPFASIGHFVNDAGTALSTMTPVELLGLIVIGFIGLIILRRVFF